MLNQNELKMLDAKEVFLCHKAQPKKDIWFML